MSGETPSIATRCAICDTLDKASEIYPARLGERAFSAEVFSARRLPDRLHYRIVRCTQCGLVRSDPVLDPAEIARLYAKSAFDYGEETENLKRTYGAYLTALAKYFPRKESLLEIGCGNGFFLEEALRQGFSRVMGVEPSAAAVSRASPEIRSSIVCDILRPGLLEPGAFDIVCFFQVFDHLSAPGEVLQECHRALKPGGAILLLNHNIDAISARVLGERSPIIDVEHTYLYSPRTLSRLLQKYGFEVVETKPVWNRYTLYYFIRLLPFPGPIKSVLLRLLRATKLSSLPLALPLGNMCVAGRKV